MSDKYLHKQKLLKRIEKENDERFVHKNSLNVLKSRCKYELMYESFYIGNLFFNMNQTNQYLKNDDFYIISASWFNRWKNYVFFDYYMRNIEKYLKLNNIDESTSNNEENYLFNLDEKNKAEVNNFFIETFTASNESNYPGYVENKDILYDKVLYYSNFNKPNSKNNYNIKSELINGQDYYIVSKDIWDYFKTVYGGREIRRLKVNVTGAEKNQIFIESKLKNLNIIIIKPKNYDYYDRDYKYKKNQNDFPYIIERPKMVFVSRKMNLNLLKDHFINIFHCLKNIEKKYIRSWILESKYTFESFCEYANSNYKMSEKRLLFPGLCLELFNQNVQLEEIDDFLKDKKIVIEYIDTTETHFPFKTQRSNEFSQEFQDDICGISQGINIHKLNYTEFYDCILLNSEEKEKKENEKSDNSLFVIKDFFRKKYMINSNNYGEDSKTILANICDSQNGIENEDLQKELNILKENMYLIFDKSEILLKIKTIYSNCFEKKNEKEVEKNKERIITQEMVQKKRERKKLEEKFKIKLIQKNEKKNKNEKGNTINDVKKENIIKDNEEEIELNENNSEQKEEKNEINAKLKNTSLNDKCSYCGSNINEDEWVLCEKCNKVKYCNNICLKKDSRFHVCLK